MFQNYLFYFAKRHAKTSFLTLPAPKKLDIQSTFFGRPYFAKASHPSHFGLCPTCYTKSAILKIPSGSLILNFAFETLKRFQSLRQSFALAHFVRFHLTSVLRNFRYLFIFAFLFLRKAFFNFKLTGWGFCPNTIIYYTNLTHILCAAFQYYFASIYFLGRNTLYFKAS